MINLTLLLLHILKYQILTESSQTIFNYSYQMNIWFRTSGGRKISRNNISSSSVRSLNSSLPTITEHNNRYGGVNEDQYEQGYHENEIQQIGQGSSNLKLNQSSNLESNFGFKKQKEQQNVPILNKHESNSSDHHSEYGFDSKKQTNKLLQKSVNIFVEQTKNQGKRSVALTNSSYGITKQSKQKSLFYQQIEQEQNAQNQQFYRLKYDRRQSPALSTSHQQLNISSIILKSNADQKSSSINKQSSLKVQKQKKKSSGINYLGQNDKTRTILNKTQRSNVSGCFSRSRMNAYQQENDWNPLMSKHSNDNKAMGSIIKTTGRKQNIKEHIISVIEYCSNQVGMAIYNTTNGEIYICQIIERLTYFRSISTIQRFYPIQIIYSASLQHTPFIKKLKDKFRNVNFRSFKRMVFDQTKGYQIYSLRGNKQQYNPDNKFIAYSSLSALMYYLQNSYDTTFNYNSLKIKWHALQDLLIIQSQTIFQLQIFLNAQTKSKNNCFIDNFNCLTYGGTRMLRANFLQPLYNQKAIFERQQLVTILLQDKLLYDTICTEIAKFKNFEIITAKFIQTPKQRNIKSLRCYLSAIYSLSHMCLLLKKFYHRIQSYIAKNLPLINKLFSLLNDYKINQLRENIQSNFDEEILRTYENSRTSKRQNFVFLFKIDRMQDDFIQVLRITYSHTMQDILQIFKQIKERSGLQLKLLYNQFRGYYIKSMKKINLSQLSQKIEDDIIQINQRKDFLLFSTSMLVSLNNRLKQSQKKLILLSQKLLNHIIQDIQKNIDVLFDINYEISVIDMILSFVGFIKKYNMVRFTKPVLKKGSNTFEVQGLKTIWTNQSKFKISNSINLKVSQNKTILIFQKQPNSFDQLNLMYSIGYLTILTQIGCYVPANSFITDIYSTLMSKIHISESIQNNLSHFQIQLYNFKNILDNSQHQHSKCLILLDQLIKGTQYEQQISLSLALINQLSKLKGKTVALVSDFYQLKIIDKIGSIPSLIFLNRDLQIEDNQQNKNNLKKLIHSEKNQQFCSPIQIEYTTKIINIQQMMPSLNFNADFINRFKKLSVHQDSHKQIK